MTTTLSHIIVIVAERAISAKWTIDSTECDNGAATAVKTKCQPL